MPESPERRPLGAALRERWFRGGSGGALLGAAAGDVFGGRVCGHAADNALVIVHSIELDRTVEPVTATGGILHCTSPWTIEEETLTVISYIHRTGL